MDFLSVVEDTRSVGGNSGEEAEHIATSTRTSSRCKEGSTDKLNMSQGYPTESCNGEISQDEHEQHISNDNYSKSKACKDEGEDALMLQCDEDINGCDWSPPLPVQLVEDNSSNQLHEQEQGKENEEESNQELAAKEDEQKGDLKATSSSEEDLITTNNSNSLQVVVEECTKDLQKKEHPLYALRRNPKRSRRFIDQEYALDSSAPAAGAAAAAATPKKSTTSIFTEKARACTECGKEFLSWKALFGHMRCHPEREWRGIQRPDNLSDYKFPKPGGGAVRRSNKKPRQAPVPTPLLLDDDQDEELEAMYIKVIASDNESDTESIEAVYINGGCNSSGGFNSKGKIITGKRSKRSRQQQTVSRSSLQEFVAASTTATDTTPAEIKEERDMARCLVMLACAGRMSSSSLGFEDEEEEGTSTTNHIAHKYNGVASGSSNGMEEDFEDEEVTGLNNEGELEQEEDEQQDDLHHFHQAVQHATGLKECMGINNVSLLCANGELLDHDFDGTRMKYECSTCKRIFKSHQALGGHRASHKKVKGCFAKTNLSNTDGIQQHQQQESAEEDITDEEFLRSDEQLLPLDLNDHHLHHHHHHHSILPIIPSSTILAAAQSHPHHHAFDTATGISNSFKVKDEVGDTNFSSRKISIKGHECSICHRVFTSGQALGGHKRCHWGGTERTGPENLISSKPGSSMHLAQVVALAAAEAGVTGGLLSNNSRTVTSTKEELLDLNLPALVEDECEDEDDAKDDNDHSKKNTMDAMYKLPQPVSSCALKKNSGAFSGLIEVMNSHNSHQDLP